MIRIKATTTQARRKIRAMYDRLRPSGRRRVMRVIARKLRDEVRNRFTTQGGGTWAPLGDWVVLKTGRRKALIGLRSRIQYRLTADDAAEVYFDAPTNDWSIAVHDKGGVSPPVENKSMVVPLKGGRRLRWSHRGASVIPARRIWLTPAETRRIVSEELDQFAREVENA